ncbi:hypothetical protein MSG28_012613 [Choristoneura fumiferana]|uniref:Uncharacterized protein n=1 Tax=Choristoneura fumiferana TaxID=7141 RepID=A0ACC0JH72_CHOFU|nr:hypothetical protein MSG28_012613 [Choristoneura fumiferana]
MFFKLNLILICVFLFNLNEVNSDCDDFIKCIGDWFGNLLTEDKKNNTVKAIEVPDVISAAGDLLSDISHLIEDTFKTTIETSFTKNIGNKTEIYVETFKLNDKVIKNNGNSKDNKIKHSNIIDKVTGHVNDTNGIAENVLFHMGLELKENETETKQIQKKNENDTEMPIAFTGFNIVSTTVETSYDTINNVKNETVLTNINDSIKMALSEEYLDNKSILPEIGNLNTGYDNLNFTTVILDQINVTYGLPLNVTETFVNNTVSIQSQNASNIFINIPETVAYNYKITFESPINVTYFEINTGKKLNVGTNSTDMTNATDFSTKEEIKSIENQNVQENEIIASEYEFDEVVVDDNTTDYLAIDYIDLYKDTTNEDVEYTPATYIPTTTEAVIKSLEVNETNGIYSVFPWIATVFIKNNENNQFDYICDGAVLSERVVLTAARCILRENVTVDVENILVILGKRSLQENGPNEKVLRTTGWHVTGQLTPIYFDKESSKTCKKNTDALTTFCAVFGDDITTCPSYGGLFVARHNATEWSVQGLTTGSPTNRGACFNKNVTFTNISHYYKWIMDNIEMNKV